MGDDGTRGRHRLSPLYVVRTFWFWRQHARAPFNHRFDRRRRRAGEQANIVSPTAITTACIVRQTVLSARALQKLCFSSAAHWWFGSRHYLYLPLVCSFLRCLLWMRMNFMWREGWTGLAWRRARKERMPCSRRACNASPLLPPFCAFTPRYAAGFLPPHAPRLSRGARGVLKAACMLATVTGRP